MRQVPWRIIIEKERERADREFERRRLPLHVPVPEYERLPASKDEEEPRRGVTEWYL